MESGLVVEMLVEKAPNHGRCPTRDLQPYTRRSRRLLDEMSANPLHPLDFDGCAKRCSQIQHPTECLDNLKAAGRVVAAAVTEYRDARSARKRSARVTQRS